MAAIDRKKLPTPKPNEYQQKLARPCVKKRRGHSLATLTTFWTFLTTYLPRVDICEGIPFKKKGENPHTVDISSNTYLPSLVNVVCERPLA